MYAYKNYCQLVPLNVKYIAKGAFSFIEYETSFLSF